jgi:anhydro-N-acetylmuramic acid kinase
MSGTSLDGLDIAACQFWKENEIWNFKILNAETYAYLPQEITLLKSAFSCNGMELVALHHQFGKLLGQQAKMFCQKYQLTPNYVASHGHTIFHQPHNGFTFQLGHGAEIAANSGIATICDFRTSDVAYGGQGAPLVPVGDELLFGKYDYCLNLGGISNISFSENGKRNAFDVGICNMALNELAHQKNQPFDKDGAMAQSGVIEHVLLNQLLNVANNHHQHQHALGFEWYLKFIKPVVDAYDADTANKLRTFCEFIALQVANVIAPNKNVLVTGGGAKNIFLMDCIQQKSNALIIKPNDQLVDFKEALIFAFLGLLRIREEVNCLQSVTGASKNSIGACIYLA